MFCNLRLPLLVLGFIVAIGCQQHADQAVYDAVPTEDDLSSYVNPFIGTGGHGHTFPGATMPFGMVQLSPDTRLDGWDGCGGYHFSDDYIYGFSHTHLSGTGVSDYGDILLMPTNQVLFNNGADGSPGYRAHFSHEDEEASAGYYHVLMDSVNIDVELTTTLRAGVHRYKYPTAENQFLVVDLQHRDKLLTTELDQVSDRAISGHRHSEAWARDQRLFYFMEFSHNIERVHYPDQKDSKARVVVIELVNPDNDPVEVKVGISAVSEEGAQNNLREEMGSKGFDQVREEVREAWQKQLSKIAILEDDHNRKEIFYTALYHTMIAPNLYQDVDGQYRGMDLEIHQSKEFEYYTVFSLWDTYRATHPLYTLIEQKRTNDFVKTMLAKYSEGGIMPIWDLSANYTGCMIGYHAVPVIADAYLKGIGDFDANQALTAMKHSADQDNLGLKSFHEQGFISVEEESESVSKTLEYAYDDWTIAMMAKKLGREGDYQDYVQRAQAYKNLFDPSTGFMRGRFNNAWFGPFDPYEVNFNYTEANAWQYSLYVPQDISGHIEMMGGKDKYEAHLDRLFTAKQETAGRHQADITGLIGQYAHGNEPSHHMAYLYNYVNKPSKTQEKVYEILTRLYSNTPDGISGNEDCGQMSAWYVLSALGFYPVTPGSDQYIIGTPMVEKATLNLENGNRFTIVANGVEQGRKYIAELKLNGQSLNRSYITHDEIMGGGVLVFTMSDSPTEWATEDSALPLSSIKDHLILPVPFIAEGEVVFGDSTVVALGHIDASAEIYYQLGEAGAIKYQEPFVIKQPVVLTVYAQKGDTKSVEIETKFNMYDPDFSIVLSANYANEYSAGGNNALIDGITGTLDFRTGSWQGYQNQDVVATIDLGEGKDVDVISASFLQDQRSWIFFPPKVILEISEDGSTWTSLAVWKSGSVVSNEEAEIMTAEFKVLGKRLKKVRLTAKTLGNLPEWHLGYEHQGTAWIFIDEISIR